VHYRIDVPRFPGSYVLASAAPARAAFVFVHGFLGDSEATWRDFQRLIRPLGETSSY
jgi:hypothetical protein